MGMQHTSLLDVDADPDNRRLVCCMPMRHGEARYARALAGAGRGKCHWLHSTRMAVRTCNWSPVCIQYEECVLCSGTMNRTLPPRGYGFGYGFGYGGNRPRAAVWRVGSTHAHGSTPAAAGSAARDLLHGICCTRDYQTPYHAAGGGYLCHGAQQRHWRASCHSNSITCSRAPRPHPGRRHLCPLQAPPGEQRKR